MAKHVICGIENRFIFVKGYICPKTLLLVKIALRRLLKNNFTKPIDFFISSEGGDSNVTWGIMNLISNSGVSINTIVVGVANSAAFLILQAGEKRFAIEDATMRFHKAVKTKRQVLDVLKKHELNVDVLSDLLNDLHLLDARQMVFFTYRGKPASEIARLFQENAQISAQMAKKLNLIDGILPKSKIPKI